MYPTVLHSSNYDMNNVHLNEVEDADFSLSCTDCFFLIRMNYINKHERKYIFLEGEGEIAENLKFKS